MSSTPATSRAVALWQAPIGKKAVMAVTGVVLYGFVFVHMAANLQFFLGGTALDDYGAKLRELPALLWGTRALLLVSLVAHVAAAVQLVARARAARPERYRKLARRDSSYASRSMALGGLALLAFVIFHILHMTTGHAHPAFVHGAVRANVISGLSVVPVGVAYLVAMLALGLHLFHGVWSSFQSLGLSHPKYTPKLKAFAKGFAFVVAVGFATVPVAVLAGVGL